MEFGLLHFALLSCLIITVGLGVRAYGFCLLELKAFGVDSLGLCLQD